MSMKKILLGVLMASVTFAIQSSREYLFTSESVTEGHPDKLCDQISDAILDAHFSIDPNARVACEVAAFDQKIIIGGEITSLANVDAEKVARNVIRKVGYTDSKYGIDSETCQVEPNINSQSPDIALGVDKTAEKEQGAGDQGLMFGYACDETPELMPLPISLAHSITRRLAELRKDGTLPWVKPDGKSQVTVKYIDGKPVEVTTVVVSTQHSPEITQAEIRKQIIENVIKPVCKNYLTDSTRYFINPTGIFTIGGPKGDAGLTGRKIIVDTYGGKGRHGGGCFSGKDPSKVDRSSAYMVRHVAKNIVAAGLAKRCEVQIAYSIGVAQPVSIFINTFDTGEVDEIELENAVEKIFPLTPAGIIKYLDLKRPIYEKTAAYGHFGRNDKDFTWEKINKVEELKKYFNK